MRPLAFAAAAALAALALPTAAHAGRLTLGVGLGQSQAAADAEAQLDASGTATLWGRYDLGRRLSANLELSRISTDEDATAVRLASGRLLFDVAHLHGGALVPTVGLGLGFGSASSEFRSDDFSQVDLGLGLEYRTGPYVVGADLRTGNRTVEQSLDAQPGVLARLPSTVGDGDYRSLGIYLGMRL